MAKAPLPENEAARLSMLESYEVLDTPDEEAFDEIARIASLILDMPIALVSLVVQPRVWEEQVPPVSDPWIGYAALEQDGAALWP